MPGHEREVRICGLYDITARPGQSHEEAKALAIDSYRSCSRSKVSRT